MQWLHSVANTTWQATRRAAPVWLLLAGAWLAVGAQAGSCGKTPCLSPSSVVHAAGVPPDLVQAAAGLDFDGNRLASAAAPALQRLAAEIQRLPVRAVLTLQVAADQGLPAGAARSQAAARVKALQLALTNAGVPAGQIKINAVH